MQIRTINSLPELLQFQEELDRTHFYCFRGQSDADWGLIPSLYHGLEHFSPPPDLLNDGEWVGQMERDMLREFDRRGRIFSSNRWDFSSPWHHIFLAQHFGVPTRLLDWTRSLLVAAYFAVTANPGKDAVIWSLNVTDFPFPKELGRLPQGRGYRITAIERSISRLDLSFFQPVSRPITEPGGPVTPAVDSAIPSDQSGSAELNGFLVIVEPPVIEERIKNQESLFTIYLSYNDYDFAWNHADYIQLVEKTHSSSLLTKINIPSDSKEKLQSSLERNGIDPHFIFPDLPGLVMLLKNQRESSLNFYSNDRKSWKW